MFRTPCISIVVRSLFVASVFASLVACGYEDSSSEPLGGTTSNSTKAQEKKGHGSDGGSGGIHVDGGVSSGGDSGVAFDAGPFGSDAGAWGGDDDDGIDAGAGW